HSTRSYAPCLPYTTLFRSVLAIVAKAAVEHRDFDAVAALALRVPGQSAEVLQMRPALRGGRIWRTSALWPGTRRASAATASKSRCSTAAFATIASTDLKSVV